MSTTTTVTEIGTIEGDTPLHRQCITELTPEQAEMFVSSLQQRRAFVAPALTTAKSIRATRVDKSDVAAMNRYIAKFEKELAAADKAIKKLEETAAKLATIRIQVGA